VAAREGRQWIITATRLLPWLVPALVLAGAGLAAGLVADSPAAHAAARQAPDEPDGAFLYGRDCVSCHGIDGLGGWRGPSLEGTGAAGNYYVLATGRMPISHPHEPIRRSTPAYSEAEIAALVDHVTSLVDGPDLPELGTVAVDLPRGGALYRLHCAACHGSTGVGVALALDAFAPPILDAEAAEVAAVMAAGAGAMPAFYPRAFTDEEFEAVVAYTQHLREPLDQGGLPFGRAGRVDEALAAWGVGILVLVLLAAWIARAPAR
jgi:ubiquinol-cytochrome c reductase cytochrome c subunit